MVRARVIAIAALGAGLAVVVGLRGTPAWQVARVAVVVAGTAGAIAVERRPRGISWNVATMAIGTVGTAVGLGLAFLRQKHGTTDALSLPAVVVTVAGVILLASSALFLLRRADGWRKVPLAVGLALAVVVTLYIVTIAVAANNAPRAPLGTETPADRGVGYRDVHFRTGDGLELAGWYLPTRDGSGVVMVAGSSSTRQAGLDQAVALNRQGFGILLYDARGHGGSDGQAMEFGWYGDEDVSAAARQLSRMPGIDPGRIGGVGFSKGAEEVLGAMAADRRIRAAVAEGATGRQPADKAWMVTHYGVPGRVQQVLDSAVYGLTDLLNDAGTPTPLRRAVARSAPRPVLLIAAGTVADERFAAAYVRGASPHTVTVWVAKDSDHVRSFRQDPSLWTTTVTRFLRDALR